MPALRALMPALEPLVSDPARGGRANCGLLPRTGRLPGAHAVRSGTVGRSRRASGVDRHAETQIWRKHRGDTRLWRAPARGARPPAAPRGTHVTRSTAELARVNEKLAVPGAGALRRTREPGRGTGRRASQARISASGHAQRHFHGEYHAPTAGGRPAGGRGDGGRHRPRYRRGGLFHLRQRRRTGQAAGESRLRR